MGPSHYGELGVIQSSVDFFGTFAGFGLSLTATKHIAEFRTKDPQRAGRILALSTATAAVTGVVVAIALFVLAPWLAVHTLAAPQLTSALRIGAALLFFAAITGAQSGALYGFEAFQVSARVQAIVGLLNVPCMIGGYLIGGLQGILWGMVAARMGEWALKHAAVRREARRAQMPIEYRESRRELPVLWKFSLPALLSGALVAPVYWICSAILVNRPNGYAEMGVFNAANQWYGALLFLPVTLGTSLHHANVWTGLWSCVADADCRHGHGWAVCHPYAGRRRDRCFRKNVARLHHERGLGRRIHIIYLLVRGTWARFAWFGIRSIDRLWHSCRVDVLVCLSPDPATSSRCRRTKRNAG
jgi:hypothetical protein